MLLSVLMYSNVGFFPHVMIFKMPLHGSLLLFNLHSEYNFFKSITMSIKTFFVWNLQNLLIIAWYL